VFAVHQDRGPSSGQSRYDLTEVRHHLHLLSLMTEHDETLLVAENQHLLVQDVFW